MTDEKIREWLDRYEQKLSELDHQQVYHLRTMIPRMRVFLEEQRREKLMRWIGFIQGALWSEEVFTLDELKEHNKPDEPKSLPDDYWETAQ